MSGERWSERLSAYRDGELGPVARWRVARRLRRSPELRAELAAMASLGEELRRREADHRAPPLWDDLAPRLRVLDAAGAGAASGAPAPVRGSGWAPALAGAAAAGIAVLALWLLREAPPAGPEQPRVAVAGSVRSLDTGGRPVLVEDRPEVTIIWLVDAGAGEA